MLTFDEVVGDFGRHPDLTDDVIHAIRHQLLPACWILEKRMRAASVDFPVSLLTLASVGGHGGFRPRCSAYDDSPHCQGLAVDRYDPAGAIDDWCLRNQHVLEECGIWLMHPSATPGWSHWQCVGPRSKARVFRP